MQFLRHLRRHLPIWRSQSYPKRHTRPINLSKRKLSPTYPRHHSGHPQMRQRMHRMRNRLSTQTHQNLKGWFRRQTSPRRIQHCRRLAKNASKSPLTSKKQYCPTCRVCEFKCAPGAIKVKKAFEGKISINQQKCPEGCHDCLDVCPITGTLTLGEDKKVHVNDLTCTYCGACKNVCPVDEALVVKRTKVLHTPFIRAHGTKRLSE